MIKVANISVVNISVSLGFNFNTQFNYHKDTMVEKIQNLYFGVLLEEGFLQKEPVIFWIHAATMYLLSLIVISMYVFVFIKKSNAPFKSNDR